MNSGKSCCLTGDLSFGRKMSNLSDVKQKAKREESRQRVAKWREGLSEEDKDAIKKYNREYYKKQNMDGKIRNLRPRSKKSRKEDLKKFLNNEFPILPKKKNPSPEPTPEPAPETKEESIKLEPCSCQQIADSYHPVRLHHEL